MSQTRDGARGIGDNMPPDENPLLSINPEKFIDVTAVLPVLKLNYHALVERRDELLKGVADWAKNHTAPGQPKPRLDGEQDIKDTTDVIRQIRDFLSHEVDATRKKVTAPIDKAKKDVQQFFARDLTDKLEADVVPVRDALSLALREKEERERLRLRQEAWDKAQLANRLAVQSARATGVVEKESLYEHALQVDDEARALEAAAAASTAKVTQTRTDLGQVTGLRVTGRFEVVNLMELLREIVAGRLPVEWVTINETYANNQIRPKDGVRSVPGLEIFEEKVAR